MKQITVGGIDYKIEEDLQAVHSSEPLGGAESVLSDGGEYYSIVPGDIANNPVQQSFPVIERAGLKGVLTGKVTLTLADEAAAEPAAEALTFLGYARVGGRGRAMIVEKRGGDAQTVVDDAVRMSTVPGVEKATPQVLFPKDWR
jgi:hypothetical protein